MKNNQENCQIIYRPILFIIGTFIISWICAGLMARINYSSHVALFTFLDFMENASPLFCALVLFREYFVRKELLFNFFLGTPNKASHYAIVFALFVAQFFNFYLFKIEGVELSVQVFMITFVGQFMLGGGLEEGGWRGYLLPCLYKKYNILFASVLVSIVWVFWHLPYFFISGSMQAGESFLSYALIGIITGFILTAIYLLTKSVLLCMLFHSWQNTIVMTVQADMLNIWFAVSFILLGVVSILICMFKKKQDIL